MNVIETLTMAEIEELSQLTGTDFVQILEKGLKPGRPMAALAWVVAKRTNANAKIDEFMAMTLMEMAKWLEGAVTDPKA